MITIILLGGAEVWIDLELDKGRCKACHKTIYWASTSNGKKMPICQDLNGKWISHFADCPKSEKFRRKTDYIPNTNGIESLGKFDERRLPKL